MEKTTEQRVEETVREVIEMYNIEYSALFIPTKQEERWPHMNWSITLENENHTFTFPFKQGSGHVQYSIYRKGNGIHSLIEIARKKSCKDGLVYSVDPKTYSVIRTNRKQSEPKIHDVLHSVVLGAYDAKSMIFTDWCEEFGEDPDSRKALEIYLDCQKLWRNFRQLFGSEDIIEQLREVYLDY